MFDRLGLDDRDRRNLKITIAIMTVLMYGLADGSIGTRLFTAVAGGLISGGVFVVATVVINQFKPDYW